MRMNRRMATYRSLIRSTTLTVRALIRTPHSPRSFRPLTEPATANLSAPHINVVIKSWHSTQANLNISPRNRNSPTGNNPTNKMQVSCQCGSVTFSTPTPTPLSVICCHCTQCQKQSASAFGTSAIFPAVGLFPLSDALKSKLKLWTRPTKEGRSMDCYFCTECGTRLFHRIREADGTERETVSIKGGCVEGLDFRGAKHIYVDSAVVDLPEEVERYPATPPIMEGRPSPSGVGDGGGKGLGGE